MKNPAATLHCPNNRCQAANPPNNKFCQTCRTPLVKRYLWALGAGLEAYKPGEAIASRYLLVNSSVLLDTQPAIPPETAEEIPPEFIAYLRLSPYQLHLPQLYGVASIKAGRKTSQLWLLEEAPIWGRDGSEVQGQLLPELTSAWKSASAVRQLNWLWQWANLWQPFSSEGVASSLLVPTLLRVEGSILRLLKLQPDPQAAPTLQQLGQLWSQLLPDTSPVIAGFCQKLCTQLRDGQIHSSEQLVTLLDRGLKDCGQAQSRRYHIFTHSDAGPSRHQNEDACYPPSGQPISSLTNTNALAIVCDGIGGHEGGEVASNLAIDILRQRVGKLATASENWEPMSLTLELEKAACAANDAISQQNDSEQRSERQRMGTTLVMAQSCAHEMYITHVGDSRVYWVTRHNCHQITQDDDLASREVRLGYSLYRNAVQQPTSGSLVQALGMAPSATLHPTTQRFVLDEDSIFLLCSDGLSDNDRVEQYWQTEILPILDGQIDLPTAAARLIEIGNRQNGHDNVTVALVYCQVTPFRETKSTEVSPPQTALPNPASTAPSRMKTQQLSAPAKVKSPRPWGLLLGIVFLLGLGGVLAYLLLPRSLLQLPTIVSSSSNSSPPPNSPPPATSPTPNPSPLSGLDAPAVIQITRSTPLNSQDRETPLLLRRELPSQEQLIVGQIPPGSVLQAIGRSPDREWLQLKVCSVGAIGSDIQPPQPQPTTPEAPQQQSPRTPNSGQTQAYKYAQVQPGNIGWMREKEILPLIEANTAPTSAQLGECAAGEGVRE